jgi:hypothetical protein
MDSGESIVWDVDILRLRCRMDNEGGLHIQLDTLATGYRGSP